MRAVSDPLEIIVSDPTEPAVTTEAVQTLPLDKWHRDRGARMVPFAGYAMPVQYDGIIAEHLWTRASAGLFDVSHMGQLMVHGERADDALEAIMPGEFKLLGEGRLRYSMLLAPDGGIFDDLMVTRRGGHFYVVVNGATKHDDLDVMRHRLPRTAIDHLQGQALLALQGPRAAAVLERIARGVSALSFMQGAAFPLAGVSAWISRSGYTGEDGFEISIAASVVEQVAERIMADPLVKPIGLGARDSLRLEAGLPLYGHDIDRSTTPVMADLAFAIGKRRRAEGGFDGAERILGELADGTPQKRIGFTLDGRQPVREGSRILDDEGNEVGRVTSGGFSPSLKRPIGMGYLATHLTAPGTVVMIEQRGKLHYATIAALPFVPHRYQRKVPA